MITADQVDTRGKPKILMTGLRVDGDVPQYFRELYGTPAEIEAKIKADERNIIDDGYDITLYYMDERDEQRGLDWIDAKLCAEKFAGVMIGTGLRMMPLQTVLFEKVVNVVRRASPQSLMMFNDRPGGNFDAIKRNFDAIKRNSDAIKGKF